MPGSIALANRVPPFEGQEIPQNQGLQILLQGMIKMGLKTYQKKGVLW